MFLKKRFRQDKEAISPVVATLMLVLVAVASVTGFYVFMNSWQNDTEDQVDDTDISYTTSLTIGGSSTVYAFSTIAAEQYMLNNTDVKINVGYTSSGSGLTALKAGAIDIAGFSKTYNSATSGYSSDVTAITIGYDAAVVIISDAAATEHGLTDISTANLLQIYRCNGGVSGTYTLDTDTSHVIEWDEVPVSTATGAAMCTGTEAVLIYDRSTESGTEEVFAKNMLGLSFATLEESGITCDGSYTGNPELIAAVEANADSIGFTSMGEANAVSDITSLKFNNVAASTKTIKDNTYAGARPLNLLVMNEDLIEGSEIKAFIDYCLIDSVNQQICEESGFISLYA